MSDRVLGTIGLLFAAIFIWQATLIQESFIQDVVGPKTFPIIIAIVMAIASVYFIIRPDADPIWPKAAGLIEIGLAALVLISYALALPEIGFGTATAIAATYLAWRLGCKPFGAVLTGLGTSAGLYLVFRVILGLSLARGPLGF